MFEDSLRVITNKSNKIKITIWLKKSLFFLSISLKRAIRITKKCQTKVFFSYLNDFLKIASSHGLKWFEVGQGNPKLSNFLNSPITPAEPSFLSGDNLTSSII